MQTIADIIHIIILSYIAMIEDLLSYDNLVNCKSFVDNAYYIIEKIANELMIYFDAEKFTAYINTLEKLAI